MPKLNDLGLTQEQVGTADFANMPEQRGGFTPPLYPGPYRFKLPVMTAASEIWDKLTTDRGDRLNVLFEGGASLQITQSVGGAHDGESFETRISAAERNRAKHGEPEQLVSDLDYLLRDAFKVETRPKTNLQYAQALIALSGREFTADSEWNWYCSKKRDIYVSDGASGSTLVEGQKGCDARYYQGGKQGVQKMKVDPNDPNSPLVWPERVVCSGKDGIPCGALVRAFANLRNFRP